MAKRKYVQTYGRHRNRVVLVEDPWADVVESGRTRVFGSSFSDSALSNSSHSSQEASLQHTRNKKNYMLHDRSDQKENESINPLPRRLPGRKVKAAFTFSDSNASGESGSSSAPRRPCRILRDRSNMVTTTGKRRGLRSNQKQALRQKQLHCSKTKGSVHLGTESYHFSDLDNYSLILSESPARKQSKVVQPSPLVSARTDSVGRKFRLSTSTPHISRNMKQSPFEDHPSELSHIASSPVMCLSVASSAVPSPGVGHLAIHECSVQLERLDLSTALSSPSNSCFGDISKVSSHCESNSYHTCESQPEVCVPSKGRHNLRSAKKTPHEKVPTAERSPTSDSIECRVSTEELCDRLKAILKQSEEVDNESSFNLSGSQDTSYITHRMRGRSGKDTNSEIDMSNITQRSRRKKQDSNHGVSMSLRSKHLPDSAYDASESLFEDLTGVSEVGHVLRNGRVLGSVNESSEEEEEEEEEESSEYEEVTDSLSYIAEEEACLDEEEEEESGPEEEDAGEEGEEWDSAEQMSSESDSDLDTSDTADATHYMLAGSNPSSPDCSLQQPHTPGKPLACVSSSCDSPFRTPHSKIPNRLVSDLQKSCKSFKLSLTPLRLRHGGERIKVVSERDKVLQHCNQTEPCSFTECIPPSVIKTCVKIGEGVYGEVFRAQRNRRSVALKIIPIEGSFPVNDEAQKTYAEILPEIVISKELSALDQGKDNGTVNFVQVHSVSVVQGCYPAKLLQQWDEYHRRKVSENDRPDIFDKDQVFLVFEFEDSGCDLEGIQLESLEQAYSILYQVTLSLAIAEKALEFEHRDMHWGNVLIKRTNQHTLDFRLDGQDVEVKCEGVKVAIIDFTLSRLVKDGCHVFTDLSTDPTLFEGHGDYQFEVYRAMKDENGNEWSTHHPYSNVLWVHYLADKLIKEKSYKDSSSRGHKSMSRQFRTFLREALDYTSCLHLFTSCPLFTENPL